MTPACPAPSYTVQFVHHDEHGFCLARSTCVSLSTILPLLQAVLLKSFDRSATNSADVAQVTLALHLLLCPPDLFSPAIAALPTLLGRTYVF